MNILVLIYQSKNIAFWLWLFQQFHYYNFSSENFRCKLKASTIQVYQFSMNRTYYDGVCDTKVTNNVYII